MTNLAYMDLVKWKIESLLKSFYISGEIAKLAMKEVEMFEELINRMFWGSRRRCDKEIRAAINKLRDAIQSHVSKRTVSEMFCLEEVKHEIHSFTERVKKMEKDLVDELYQSMPEEEEEEDDDEIIVSSTIYSKMVGLSDQYSELKSKIINEGSKLKVLSVVGMGGIGKTTLARNVYEDADVLERFDLRVWVTVGRKCRLTEILRRIVAQLYSDTDQMLAEANHDDVIRLLRESLMGKKFLIVLDDVWGKYVEYYLQRTYIYVKDEMKNPFTDEGNGSRVLLTSRLQQIDERNIVFHEGLSLRLLNEDESWDLLREKVFGEESCPFKLEKFGKKIAENCDGLPLTIVTIANLLCEEEKILEYWSEIAAHKNHQIFLKAYDQVSKVLLPSYKYLPRMLQMCFLYMGVFPKKFGISRSKLINMWKTDGFLEINAHTFSYPSEIEYVDELVINNLIVIHQKTRDSSLFGGMQIVKTCGLHSSLWYLSIKEGEKTKFFHVINYIDDCFGQGIEGQHRLSFHNNILFGIKEVHKSVEDNCASTTHSLLCYGPYHRYPVPMCFGLRFLKKLDALTIRFYEFPIEVVQLYQLKYLTLTLDGNIPSSISQLLSLQFLIVNQHLSIKSCSDPSYLPIEIWDMKELQHLQIMGSDLPNPCGAYLENLSTLSNVSALSCAEGILTAIPHLNKLGIRIELNVDNEDGHPLRCLDHISRLTELRSLKCVVLNPDLDSAPTPLPIFPSHLQKLSLSGMGYCWREMSNIASLPNLYILKLRSHAFQGPVWEVKEEEFFKLVLLVIEDTDLVEWKIGRGSFQGLGLLSIRHCYKLEKIEGEFEIFLENIEVDDCGPLAEICAEQIRKDRMRKRDVLPEPNVDVHSSWNDG